MISEKMLNALNEQVNAEMASSYLYLAMSHHFQHEGWVGAAKWLDSQAKEEWGHAAKFLEYINDRGGKVELKAIAKPKASWPSLLAAFKEVAKHEKLVTSKIHALADLAAKEKDHATGVLLQWYITEQVEEEATADQIVDALTKIGDSTNGIFMMDHRLGHRE